MNMKKNSNLERDIVIDTNLSEEKFVSDILMFWREIISSILPLSKYVEFGVWEHETFLIEEIANIENVICINSYGPKQKSFTCSIDEKIKDLLMHNCIINDKQFKWFDLSILEENDSDSIIFNTRHFGTKYCLWKLKENQLENIKNICDKYSFSYEIY